MDTKKTDQYDTGVFQDRSMIVENILYLLRYGLRRYDQSSEDYGRGSGQRLGGK